MPASVLGYRHSKMVKMWLLPLGLVVETAELLPPSKGRENLPLGSLSHSVIGQVIS